MDPQTFDVIVLGGGNAISVARDTAAAGMKVALIEKGPLGGTCPNRGCIPSKLFLAFSETANRIREAGRFYIDAEIRGIDGDRILRETREYVDAFDGLLEEGLHENVSLFRGHGTFVDPKTIEVNGTRLQSGRIVVGTGSRPRTAPIPGLEGTPFWTSDDVFRLEHLPASLTVVGGGFIGCELAQFFQGVGVETTLLAREDQLLLAADEEARQVFMDGYTKRVPVHFETGLQAVAHDADGFRLTLKEGGEEKEHRSEALLLAIGRQLNSDTIGIENTGVAVSERGALTVDDRLRTNVEGIYALGDVNGRWMFTHAASYEAAWLAQQFIRGADDAIDYGPMPNAVFTSPEVASVGATEQELRDSGTTYVKGAIPYTGATKGRAIKEEHGLAKILLSPKGEILGCHIVGSEASVLLHEVIPVMKWRNHISSLTEIIHIHPSLGEVVRGAARAAAKALAESA